MAGIEIPSKSAALAANGGADGAATLASALGFYAKAHVWLSAAGLASRECAITAIVAPKLYLRFADTGAPGYGNSDISAYTTALGAAVSQPAQFVYGAALPAITDLLTTDGETVSSSGPIEAPSFTATGTPTDPTDLATKAYVDAVASGLDIKASCRTATTASVANLASVSTTMDGITLVAGDRVLVKDTASADGVEAMSGKRNGIYVVGTVAAGTAPLTRATDADASAEVTAGLFTWVTAGTAAGSAGWVLITADPIVLGTTVLTFTEFTGTYRISVGTANGLSISGNAISLAAAGAAAAGAVTTGTQTFAGDKTFSGSVSASNFSGTNTGDVTLATVGSTPAAAGASLSAQVLTLQPANGSNAGVVSTAAQTFAGEKTFSNGVATNLVEASSSSSVSVAGAPVDGSSAVGVVLSSSTTLADAASKLVQIKNGSTEKASIDKNGGFFPSGVPASSSGVRFNSDVRLTLNADNGSGCWLACGTGTANLTVTASNANFSGNVGTNQVVAAGSTLTLTCQPSDGASAIGVKVNTTSLSTAGAKLLSVQNASVEKAYVDKDGTVYGLSGFKTDFTDSSGTPGAATINKPSGRSALASAASSVVITNSLVTATSVVMVQLETSGIGVGELSVVPTTGSFTVTSINALGAATVVTGTAKFSWFVVQN